MFRNKFAWAILVALFAASFGADRSEAGGHHWGYRYYPYAHSYVSVYRPVVVAPAYYRTFYRPILGHRCVRYGYYSYGYYAPGYAWYGHSCYRSGYAWPQCSAVDSYCCGSPAVESYKSIVPPVELEPSPADLPPELPQIPEPQVPSVKQPSAPGEQPAPAPEPADDPPALPPEPSDLLPALPEAPVPAFPDSPVAPGTPTPTLPPLPDPITPAVPDAALPLLPDNDSSHHQAPDSGMLAVRVPADARVFVNGMLTRTPGVYRQYISRGLVPGSDYTYEVRIEISRNGRTHSDIQRVNLRAGGNVELAFRMDPQVAPVASRNLAPTTLTLHVPETARVTLEGHTTVATGEVRSFVTRQLLDGQRWEGYRVVVELEQDGRVETSAKQIDLVGGTNHELSFDFLPQQVALR